MYKFKNNLKKFFVITTVIMVCVLLCILGIYAFKSQVSNSDPISAVRAELNDIADREYTLDLEIISIDIDPDKSERMINTYKGSELAKERGRTDEQLNDLTAVKAIYRTEYDHSKTFIDDGYTEQYFYLIKDDPSGAWKIADISDPHILNIPKDDDTANTEAASTIDLQQSEEHYCSVDLNYDGITEDFFLCKDVRYDKFHIVMYDNIEKTIISDEVYINRVNSIDIYKTNDGDSSDYYCTVYQYGSCHNYIVACLFTGNGEYRSFNLRTYGEDLRNAINCYSYNVDMPKASFDELLADTQYYLNKYDNLEYIETINLDDYLTDNYSEEHLCDFAIVDGMTDISVYRVQNDIFGRDLKLSNGAYSYYSFTGPDIEVYKRAQKIREQSGELHNYYEAETGEYEYLLCIKALNEETAELVYLGTPNEDLIVSYYAYANVSDAPTRSGQDRDIEEFDSIMNDTASFLRQHRTKPSIKSRKSS